MEDFQHKQGSKLAMQLNWTSRFRTRTLSTVKQ